ncbi:hypothetical protein PR048_007658 [Dryococelus australis]|uniref:Uncharacterized protein n=1 Tax=Dryococelus australis TaxID=614101 RepID=A0ABQ9HVR3_9NEOP|nr:hypothetical protein PR048_007658 [Dryococelus australis]
MKFISNPPKLAVRNLDPRSAAIVDICSLMKIRQQTELRSIVFLGKALASRRGESVFDSRWGAPGLGFRTWESCRAMPLVVGFSQGYPTSPLEFRHRSIFTSFRPILHSRLKSKLIAVALEIRLALSPPTKANRAQSPAGSPDLRMWESCRTMPLVGGSSRGYQVSPAASFRRRSIFTPIALVGSQDLCVKSHPNLFTHS